MNTKTKQLLRRNVTRVMAGAVVTGGAMAMSVSGAQAAPFAVTFGTPTAGTSWVVPAGVTQVAISAYGGQGGSGTLDMHTYGDGGHGALAYGTFSVEPGDRLDLVVGGEGGPVAGGIGGGGVGGTGTVTGSGGGGASMVTSGGQTWLVAGGGGGATGLGVDGGDSGHAGAAFENGFRYQDGLPGGGAAGNQPGAGGKPGTAPGRNAECVLYDGAPGLVGGSPSVAGLATGGAGGGRSDPFDRYGGGGGGGGYAGGGGGGGGAYCIKDGTVGTGTGGSGGGGSSFVGDVATSDGVTDGVRSGDGAITITYDDPAGPTDDAMLSPAPNAAGWNNTPVSVVWNWADLLSGVNVNKCTARTYSGDRSGEVELAGTCQDFAQNLSTGSVTVRIDSIDPTAAPKASGALVDGWSRGDVTVHWHWTDALSGADPRTCPATTLVSSDGMPTVASTCTDVAGNSALVSTTVKIDRTAPKVVVESPTSLSFHKGQRVALDYHCTDAGVGVASCSDNAANGHVLPTETIGQRVVKIKAVDRLGNTHTTKVTYKVTR